jgi:hypothetical protein
MDCLLIVEEVRHTCADPLYHVVQCDEVNGRVVSNELIRSLLNVMFPECRTPHASTHATVQMRTNSVDGHSGIPRHTQYPDRPISCHMALDNRVPCIHNSVITVHDR